MIDLPENKKGYIYKRVIDGKSQYIFCLGLVKRFKFFDEKPILSKYVEEKSVIRLKYVEEKSAFLVKVPYLYLNRIYDICTIPIYRIYSIEDLTQLSTMLRSSLIILKNKSMLDICSYIDGTIDNLPLEIIGSEYEGILLAKALPSLSCYKNTIDKFREFIEEAFLINLNTKSSFIDDALVISVSMVNTKDTL
jgi:hypothetical protein